MRLAFKLAYLGAGFHGSQRQPGLRTVEGDLLEVLRTEGILADPRADGFRMASRTDRGVSALGNVVAFTTLSDPREVLVRANRRLHEIWLHEYAEVPEAFNPRWAVERWYRYCLPGTLDPEGISRAADLFLGKHDLSGWVKGGSEGICHITSIRATHWRGWTVLDIKADRFAWNVVRRIARTLELVDRGALDLETVEEALRGEPLDVEPAPPEFLCLMDVAYDFPFQGLEGADVLSDVSSLGAQKRIEAFFLGHLRDRLSSRLPEHHAERSPMRTEREA